MEKLHHYNLLKSVPKNYLKTIVGGRLKGMTDIKPQWRIEKLTEVFGMCGFGWKFEVVRKWIERVEKSEIIAFADINLYVKVGDVWSDAIPGNGGSMLTTAEKHGLHNSDEAYKMAITDALGTAAKCIGLASDVYMGHGGKYETTPEPKQQPQPKTAKQPKAKPQPKTQKTKFDIKNEEMSKFAKNCLFKTGNWDYTEKYYIISDDDKKAIEDEVRSYLEEEKKKQILTNK